jgi:hypothetical protein
MQGIDRSLIAPFGEMSVLLVPADENKRVNGTCTFVKDFYIIIYTRGIKLLK